MTIILICGEIPVSFFACDRSAVYVCICNGVTERDIRQAAEGGCRSVAELTMRTGCGATCGTCLEFAVGLLDEVHAVRELPLPVLLQNAA